MMTDKDERRQEEYAVLRATVTGRVQRVGYRAFVQAAASRLQVGGYVRNNDDDTVSVEASGTREALEQFLNALWRGPSGARVLGIEHEWLQARPGASERFEVRY